MLILSKVYPRAYGGTEQISSLIIFRKGLSPRVRGNLDEEWEATRLTIDLLAPPAVRREATARFFADGWGADRGEDEYGNEGNRNLRLGARVDLLTATAADRPRSGNLRGEQPGAMPAARRGIGPGLGGYYGLDSHDKGILNDGRFHDQRRGPASGDPAASVCRF